MVDDPALFLDITYSLTADGAGGFGLDYAFGITPNPGTDVPEPASWSLFATGIGGMLLWLRRRRGQVGAS